MQLRSLAYLVLAASLAAIGQSAPATTQSAPQALSPSDEEAKSLLACAQMVIDQLGMLKIPADRAKRFQGKVTEATALCRGGQRAIEFRGTPWVDWTNYWGT